MKTTLLPTSWSAAWYAAAALGLSGVLHAQTVLRSGHMDLGAVYEGGQLRLHIHTHEPEPDGTEYEPSEVVIEVGLPAVCPVVGESYAFLGNPGAWWFILPSAPKPDLPFLGLAAEEIETGQLRDDRLDLRLIAAVGPGQFALFSVDAFGYPIVHMNTRDGVNTADCATVQAGSHSHLNWAFTAPGDYELTLVATGTLASGATVTSNPATLRFHVVPPPRARLTTVHADLSAVYQPDDPTNKLALVVIDEDHEISYLSNQVALVVAEAARTELPADFPPLGQAGDPMWILPQTQDPSLLFLGLNAAGVPAAAFPQGVTLYLRTVQGPGDFFAWQAGLGGLDVRLNSRDGLDDTDQLPLAPGGHSHWNLGFSTNGIYELVFEVRGHRAGVETNDFSLLTPIRFEVEPLPPPEAKPFLRWQQEQWPQVADPAIIGPEADPDGDGWSNLAEYALGLDPHQSDADHLPSIHLVTTSTGRRLRLELPHPIAASDVGFRAQTAESLSPPARWRDVPGPQVEAGDGDAFQTLIFEIDAPPSSSAGFLRWAIELLP